MHLDLSGDGRRLLHARHAVVGPRADVGVQVAAGGTHGLIEGNGVLSRDTQMRVNHVIQN